METDTSSELIEETETETEAESEATVPAADDNTAGSYGAFKLSDAIRRGSMLVSGQAQTWVTGEERCAFGAAVKVAEDAGVI